MSDQSSILDRINEDLKEAMRSRDKVRLRTLRSLRAALQNREIETRESGERTALSKQDQLTVVRKQAKQRKESIEQYRSADRQDLVDKEEAELEVIDEYLPADLSDEELRERLESIIDEVGASSMADMGAVMGRAMDELRGRVDGGRVQAAVRDLLQNGG